MSQQQLLLLYFITKETELFALFGSVMKLPKGRKWLEIFSRNLFSSQPSRALRKDSLNSLELPITIVFSTSITQAWDTNVIWHKCFPLVEHSIVCQIENLEKMPIHVNSIRFILAKYKLKWTYSCEGKTLRRVLLNHPGGKNAQNFLCITSG